MSSILENLAETGKNGKAGPREFEDEQLAEQAPDLFEWLSTEIFRGQPRRTPTITLFVEDGRLKCVLNDRQEDITAFWTLTNACGLWRELQEALGADKLDWRKTKAKYGRK